MLLLQPFMYLPILTLGTMTVTAGMIAVLNLSTHLTMVDVSAKGFSAAALDIPYGLQVAGENLVPVLVKILWSKLTEEVRQLDHRNCSMT